MTGGIGTDLRRPSRPAAQAPARRGPSLSPSRAADFKTCPLLYRFRTHRPAARAAHRRPGPRHAGARGAGAAVRPAAPPSAPRRRPATWSRRSGTGCVEPSSRSWPALFATTEPAASDGVPPLGRRAAGGLLRGGGPAAARAGRARAPGRGGGRRRAAASGATSTGSTSPPDGALRVVDYKTGGAPREAFEARALFQLKFYALVLWRTRGVVPRVLRLLYLQGRRGLRLHARRRRAGPLRAHGGGAVAGDRAGHRPAGLPARSRAGSATGAATRRCCPAFGGTPPPFPVAAASADPLRDARSVRGAGRRRVTSPPRRGEVGPAPAGLSACRVGASRADGGDPTAAAPLRSGRATGRPLRRSGRTRRRTRG